MFVCVFMPLAVVFSSVYVNRESGGVWCRTSLIERAFAQQCLSKEELSKLVVVGSEPAGLLRTLFYLDNPQASLMTIPQGGECDPAKLPAGKEWVLVIGDHALAKKTGFELPMNGFTLARIHFARAKAGLSSGENGSFLPVHSISGASTIDFRKSAWPGVISSRKACLMRSRGGLGLRGMA